MKIILPILLLFIVLAVLSAHVNLPGTDEAWFASPAVNLITKGSFGTSVLDPTAAFRKNNLTGIDRHTYWIVPLYPLAQAAWYRVVGFGLMHLRYLSAVWGLLALWAWYRILMMVCGDRRVATLALGLMAVDFTVILAASWGRMDMMAAALGSAGLAAFLSLREKHLTRAILVSQACVAAAGLSHPLALGYFAGLLALTLYSDWRRIRFPDVMAACAPYLVGAAGWGLYIMQAPHDFILQFGGNAADRGVPLTDPLGLLYVQFVERFWYMFGMAPNTRGLSHMKVLILTVYAAGIAGALWNRGIRNHAGYRTLLLTGGVTLLAMMSIDNESHYFYLVHFVLWLIVFTAITAVWYWDRRSVPRWALVAVLALVVLVQLATIGRRVTQRAYSTIYLAATDYLKAHAQGKGTVMGSSELAFELGFVDSLVDDPRLGFRSGKRPNFIVIDNNRYAEWIPQYAQREPETYRYITGMMQREFHQVIDNPGYKVYARNGL
ncbi:MAG: glycosyltransferase family 39 protein [Candidatus Solibacter sp.]|nr:glycosyltransferase family 39 protein [Candidatus Solibacter sp.]